MNEPTYRCEQCGGVFTYGWSLEESDAESERLWGISEASQNPDMAMVCDDCFREIMAGFN